MTTVFVPRETAPGETRVAAVPETVARMVKHGLEVLVEAGAGTAAAQLDEAFAAAGARTVTAEEGYAAGELVLKVAPPSATEAARLRQGAVLVSFLYAHENAASTRALTEGSVTAWAMELVPRTTRAQKMDALSSQANVGGYKAVVTAANELGKYFPLLMTAAGTVKPAKVVIFGAGVAGLQAIATAKRLGAIVWATDIRPEVKEQVESLGAKFIEVEGGAGGEEPSVYAKEASDEYKRKQAEAVAGHVAEADVVVTTALIPGRKAPLLVPAAMVESMRPGSVIVDMAAGQGGNCELTQAGTTAEAHNVRIVGETNFPATVPVHASELYARNLLQVVQHLVPDEDNESRELKLDFEDEITDGSVAIHGREIRHAPTAEALQSAPA